MYAFCSSLKTTKGIFSNKLYFPDIDIKNKRTDIHFRLQGNKDHHIGKRVMKKYCFVLENLLLKYYLEFHYQKIEFNRKTRSLNELKH